jgi:hypothetical protein
MLHLTQRVLHNGGKSVIKHQKWLCNMTKGQVKVLYKMLYNMLYSEFFVIQHFFSLCILLCNMTQGQVKCTW